MANVFIGAFIFGYAGWMLFRFVKKSKKGACASCPVNSSCAKSQCQEINNFDKVE